jgi:hypothetical protein
VLYSNRRERHRNARLASDCRSVLVRELYVCTEGDTIGCVSIQHMCLLLYRAALSFASLFGLWHRNAVQSGELFSRAVRLDGLLRHAVRLDVRPLRVGFGSTIASQVRKDLEHHLVRYPHQDVRRCMRHDSNHHDGCNDSAYNERKQAMHVDFPEARRSCHRR